MSPLSSILFTEERLNPKSIILIKTVIRQLPMNIPAQDNSDGLMDLGFDVISVKYMSTNRRSLSEGTTTTNLLIFLITLPRTAKIQEIFRLRTLCTYQSG
jgi:hypothetical protein